MSASLWHRPILLPGTQVDPAPEVVAEPVAPVNRRSDVAALLQPWRATRVVVRLTRPRFTELHMALIAFAVVFAGLCGWQASRLELGTIDEGIILDAAQRIVTGQRPYIDFFGYMSPGSYWIQAAVFRVFGISMWAARIPVLFDAALQCILVFWLARALLKQRAAFACAAIFLWLEIWDLRMLTAQHRFDSATFALASIACAWHARGESRIRWMLGSGVLFAAAVVCTPALILLALPLIAWMVWDSATRKLTPAWIGGAAAVAAATVAVLWRQGVLVACIDQMFWLCRNYSGINVVRYGTVNGGLAELLHGGSGIEMLVRGLAVFWILIPAAIPLVGVAWAAWSIVRRSGDMRRVSALVLLAACVIALLASTAPRPDVTHLAYVIALPFVLCFAAIAGMRNRRLQGLIVVVFSLAAVISIPGWASSLTETAVSTPVGRVRVSGAEKQAVSALLTAVRPGDSIFVHPYLPLLYFLTQARNPTRYSYLAPGMMTEKEASDALTELQTHPPDWILYLHLEPDSYLRVFPTADPQRVRYPGIERWIAAHYEPTDVAVDGYRLMRRTEGEADRASLVKVAAAR